MLLATHTNHEEQMKATIHSSLDNDFYAVILKDLDSGLTLPEIKRFNNYVEANLHAIKIANITIDL